VKAYGAIVRIAAIAAVVWFASMAISRFLPSYGELTRRARDLKVRETQLVDSLQALQDSLSKVKAAAAADSARLAVARAAADEGARAGRKAIADLRAAVATQTMTTEEAIARAEDLATRFENQLQLHALERRATDHYVGSLKVVIDVGEIRYTTSQELADNRRHQVDALEARHTWWRQLLQKTCEAGPTVAGGVAGAHVAGPLGAGVGAGSGLLVGVLVCP
jgi:hypothetical protein